MKNIKITLLAATVMMVSCEKKEPLVSGITKKNMDTLVKPGDNFQEFVNGKWMKNTKIPADKSSYGAFDMLYDQSQKDVKAITVFGKYFACVLVVYLFVRVCICVCMYVYVYVCVYVCMYICV